MTPSFQRKSTNHLHRIIGQLSGLERMIAKDKYCVDLIQLSLAVQKSLQSLNHSLLENHLVEHVGKDWKSKKKSKEIKELLEIYNLSNK